MDGLADNRARVTPRYPAALSCWKNDSKWDLFRKLRLGTLSASRHRSEARLSARVDSGTGCRCSAGKPEDGVHLFSLPPRLHGLKSCTIARNYLITTHIDVPNHVLFIISKLSRSSHFAALSPACADSECSYIDRSGQPGSLRSISPHLFIIQRTALHCTALQCTVLQSNLSRLAGVHCHQTAR